MRAWAEMGEVPYSMRTPGELLAMAGRRPQRACSVRSARSLLELLPLDSLRIHAGDEGLHVLGRGHGGELADCAANVPHLQRVAESVWCALQRQS